MGLEQKVNSILMSHPGLKKIIKRSYQKINVLINRPKKVDGNIVCVSPKDDYDYFFGYYDKSPWDANNRYMLCMKAKDTSKEVAPNEKLEILLIDTENNNKVEKIAESHAWNVQQGCMAQWLGPDFNKKIIYNDFRNNRFCSIIYDINSKKEKVIDFPVYSVSSNGEFALSLDFSRLHRLRPGYGYSNVVDTTVKDKVPNSPCIWIVNLKNNKIEPYLYYEDFYNFEQRDDMVGADHKVNHIMISPKNDKFMVIHRWLKDNKKYSRLITCDIKSKSMFNLSDDDMVSHCCWKSNNEILGFLNKKNEGNGYFLLKDRTTEYSKVWADIKCDGHPSYSFDGKYVLIDNYPNKNRIQTLRIFSDDEIYCISKVFSPFKYDNNTRCDLHPRWSRDNKSICFDGCYEGKRRLYKVDVSNITEKIDNTNIKNITNLEKNKRIKILFFMTSCKKCGPTNQTLNIIKNLDRKIFDPYLVTIYEEEPDSQIKKFIPYITKHYTILTSKKNILLKKTKKLNKFISEFNPDLIHTVGLFPNYYVSILNNKKQITTLRNFVYEDYPAKFGKFLGIIMSKLQLHAIKNTNKVVTCSKSLSDIYINKLKLTFDFIQNGVDIEKYNLISNSEKLKLKKQLGLDKYKKIFVYTGQFIERKNIPFLLENFNYLFSRKSEFCLLLIGDGPLLNTLKEKYENIKNILFLGSTNDVSKYLSASDYYISASLSEGLPNGALEALSSGIPVVLSNIEQHKELFMYDKNIGILFNSNDSADFKKKINKVLLEEYSKLSINSRKMIIDNFSSERMSKKYQDMYIQIVNNK